MLNGPRAVQNFKLPAALRQSQAALTRKPHQVPMVEPQSLLVKVAKGSLHTGCVSSVEALASETAAGCPSLEIVLGLPVDCKYSEAENGGDLGCCCDYDSVESMRGLLQAPGPHIAALPLNRSSARTRGNPTVQYKHCGPIREQLLFGRCVTSAQCSNVK